MQTDGLGTPERAAAARAEHLSARPCESQTPRTGSKHAAQHVQEPKTSMERGTAEMAKM